MVTIKCLAKESNVQKSISIHFRISWCFGKPFFSTGASTGRAHPCSHFFSHRMYRPVSGPVPIANRLLQLPWVTQGNHWRISSESNPNLFADWTDVHLFFWGGSTSMINFTVPLLSSKTSTTCSTPQKSSQHHCFLGANRPAKRHNVRCERLSLQWGRSLLKRLPSTVQWSSALREKH